MFIDKSEFKSMIKEAMCEAILEAHGKINAKKGTWAPAEAHPQPTKADDTEAPKKRGRPAKEKVEEKAEVEAPEPEEQKADEAMTYEILMDHIRKVIDESGDEGAAAKAKEICRKKFKVEKFKELKAEQYTEALAAVKAGLSKDAE